MSEPLLHVWHLWGLVLGTIVSLLPVIDPLSAAPVFLALTDGETDARRRAQARAGCFYMVAILVSFLVGGSFLMSFFGISIPGLRIAGGMVLVRLGMEMLVARREQGDAATRQVPRGVDIAFSPLAMPMLSGPGSIAVTLGFTSLAEGPLDYLAIILGIVAMAVLTFAVLQLSIRSVDWIGPVGLDAMNRIMGFLTMCIGVQFVVNGVLDPDLLQPLAAALAGR